MVLLRFMIMVLATVSAKDTAEQQDTAFSAKQNPVRKVVNMLQAMQTRVEKEGRKEKELYEKFECYCRNGAGDLSKSISEAETKVPNLVSDIDESEAKKKQLEEDLKSHKGERDAAKSAMDEANSLRQKDAAAFAKNKAEYESNLDALDSAITAITKGMSGSFLQTKAAQILKTLAINMESLQDADRQDIMAFLAGGQEGGYVPKSGEIVGVLKVVRDDMAKAYSDAKASESAAADSHQALLAAKTKEFDANLQAIQSKGLRVGELSVIIQQMKNDRSDTEDTLAEDKLLFNDLENNCKKKAQEWDERQKTRSDELLALQDCIKVLNDDDALNLFRKTLPSPSASFVQVAASNQRIRKRALSALQEGMHKSSHRPQFDFIALAIQGKGVGLEKVVKMVEDMIGTLRKEAKDEKHKKDTCSQNIDSADDKKKNLGKKMSHIETSIEEATEGVSTLNSEIQALEDGIKALDRSVADATEQRKAEHSDFTELMASDGAAKELLQFAKNRLRKFYQPDLYKEPKQSPAEEDEEPVLAQVSAHVQQRAEPPETFGAYEKDGASILALIDHLVNDLDHDLTEAKVEEENAQESYEQLMKDSAEKRALDSKSLTEKSTAKASMESDIEASKEAKMETTSEMMATEKYLSTLHADCDFLLKYWDARSQARSDEIASLKNVKSILNGVDVSFVQQQSRNLRRR
jgi:chromosome segregation ATPase